MALTFRFGGNAVADPVDLEDSRVRLPMPPLIERAEGMTVGVSQITFDDPDGTFTVPALRGFRANEDDCSAVRLYTGFLTDRTVSYGDSEHSSLVTGTSRIWTASLRDFNHDASRVILRGSGANRPAETDVARISWYVASGFSVNLIDDGLIDTTNPVDMPPVNYDGRFALDLIQDCMNASGKNAFAYYPQSAGDDETNALAYFLATSSLYTSTLSFTSVLSEADYDLIWPVNKTPVATFDPSRVYSGIYLRYAGGSVWGADTDTYDAYYQKETSIDAPDVTTSAAASALLAKYLDDAGSEEVSVTFTVRLPSTHVNLILQGMRTAVHFPHIPGYEDGAWVRVVARTVQQARKAGTPLGGLYDVTLECRDPKFIGGLGNGTLPPSAGNTNGGLPFVPSGGGSIVQYKDHAQTGPIVLDAAPAAGNVLFLMFAGQDASNVSPTDLGWTQVQSVATAHPSFGGHTALWYRVVASGDGASWAFSQTGNTMTRLIEVSGIGTLTASARLTTQSGTGLALTVGATAGDFVLATFTTRLRSGGSFTPNGSTTQHDGFLVPAGIIGSHDYGVVGYKVNATGSTTLGGTQGGTTTDGYYWGGIIASFSANATAPTFGQWVYGETPTPVPDGSTTTFTLARSFVAGSLTVRVDLLNQTAAVTSYDAAARTFTLGYAPRTGEQISVDYQAAA